MAAYGAKGDGKTVDAAAKASYGVVVFKPCVQSLEAYPVMQTRVAGIEMQWPSALFNVYDQSHVKIGGKGTVDGDGQIWWDKYWKMRREEYEPKGLRWAVDYDSNSRSRSLRLFRSARYAPVYRVAPTLS